MNDKYIYELRKDEMLKTKNNIKILKSVWTHMDICTGNGIKREVSDSEAYRLRITKQLEPVRMENGDDQVHSSELF